MNKMKNKLYSKTINYLGKTLKTSKLYPLTDEECEEIRKEYFKRPSNKYAWKELYSISKGNTKTSNITKYYLKDIMCKVGFYHSKWTLEEAFNNNDIIRFFYGKTVENTDLFSPEGSKVGNIERLIALGGKGVACMPTKFPINTVKEVLSKYCTNNNYYDYSCGWGDRMLGALSLNINYFGTDPNYLLTERLKEMCNDYKAITHNKSIVDIRTQGSEIFIPDFENKMSVAFSSPPYFNLEIYNVGNQSCDRDTPYESWLNNYWKKTVQNIHKYLIDEGVLVVNITNFGKYNLLEDTHKICLENGFEFYETLILKNIKRINCKGNLNDNSEQIRVYTKKGFKRKEKDNLEGWL